MIDITEDKLIENYQKIRSELKNYDISLYKKKEIIFFNKSDLVEKNEIKEKILKFKKKIKQKFKIISIFKKEDMQTIKKDLVNNVSR